MKIEEFLVQYEYTESKYVLDSFKNALRIYGDFIPENLEVTFKLFKAGYMCGVFGKTMQDLEKKDK